MEEPTYDISNDVHHIDTDEKSEEPSERHKGGFVRAIAKGMSNLSPGHGNRGKKGHPKIESLVDTIIFSLSKESVQYLKGPEGEAALAGIIAVLARALSRFVDTDEARCAIRSTAQEATAGLCDGVGLKVHEQGTKLPRFALVMGVVVVGAYAVLLAVGFLLCLWRFSLYGVGEEKSARL